MAQQAMRARSGLIWLTVALLLATLLTPVSALADTNLEIGGTAVIAYANGDDVRLREAPGYDGSVVRMVREGATVDVYDGPFEDSDGNLWYQVGYDGDSGYIVSDYLALNGGAGADASIFNPAGESIGAALIAGTNNDGVRCRADADPGAAVITVVPEGAIVEITGGAIGSWQPINCAGQGGYVHLDYVTWDLDGGSTGVGGEGEVEAASVVGEAFVAGTNGDGVRCRASASYSASIITVLSEGSTVALRDVVRGDFQGVVCAGQNGYAASMYLSADGSTVGEASDDEIVGEAFVSGTNGDGVRCRSGAGFDASVITVLSEGTAVALRSGGGDGWQPVVCAGSNGYVSAEFLSSTSGGGGGGATGDAAISGTNGDGVRCRAQASFNGDVLTVLSEGAGVTLRGDQSGDWIAVVCAGMDGWVHGDYVGSGGGSDGGSSGGGASNSSFSAGDNAVVAGTNGDGVRLRSSGSGNAAIITVLSEGTSVTVIDGITSYWVAVSAAGTSGFVHMDYLSSSAEAGDDGGSGGGTLSSGDNAITTSSLNLRYDPSFSGGVAAVAPQGTVVLITGRASGGFYPVDWDGLQGYMHGDYLSWTDEILSERGGSADGGDGGGGGGGEAVGSSSVVDFAMQYLGYPYVWATHGPSSFDCSGFTYWVLSNTLGVNIGTGTMSQIGYGTPVDRNSLQPGDLVFFQNTYTWGLSHVGIYIGGNQFIHAENESTGVVISNLDSSYYASRWYGARRVG
ncbi:MAG: C40 family peptidase [Thermomicrobiales bacterium]|nr:C40 family peptidase [Thermomicrobiales bacterium]